MNLETQNAKNLISKDFKLSNQAANDIVNSADIKTFETLCKNSEYIFDFVADKAIKNLINATNKNNLSATLEFAKFYDPKFSQYIETVWQKYADEDLTDEILNIFDSGTTEQKIYAAKYFEKINDPLALEYLNKYAFDEDELLSSACACTLRAFGDKTSRNKALEMLNTSDDFQKFSAIKLLINYGLKEDVAAIINELKTSPFSSNIAQEIMYKYSFSQLENLLAPEDIIALYDEIISSYPEDITLDTIQDFSVYEFIEKNINNKNSYIQRILTDTKLLVELVVSDNIYTYDLNKNALSELKNIESLLKNHKSEGALISNELKNEKKRALRALNTLINLNSKENFKEIEELYTKSCDSEILCECARVAKCLDSKLNPAIGLEKITDANAKELFKSYF